jgi:hypothetical protein
MKGKYERSEETRKKLSETRKRLIAEGKISVWNKGLTKKDPRVRKNISGGSRKTQFKPGARPDLRGKNNPNWKGGTCVKINKFRVPYRLVRSPDHPYAVNDYVFEHRLVVEKELGRLLKPDEIIHHIDGNTLNNNLSNLLLLTKSEHTTLHNLNRWDNGKHIGRYWRK